MDMIEASNEIEFEYLYNFLSRGGLLQEYFVNGGLKASSLYDLLSTSLEHRKRFNFACGLGAQAIADQMIAIADDESRGEIKQRSLMIQARGAWLSNFEQRKARGLFERDITLRSQVPDGPGSKVNYTMIQVLTNFDEIPKFDKDLNKIEASTKEIESVINIKKK